MPPSSFVRNAGILCIAGALIAMTANALSAQADPAVAEDITSYPLSTSVFVVAQILFALTQAMMLMGVLGLVRAHAIGRTTLATIGAWLAVIGIGLTVPGELGFGIIASSETDSTSAMIVSTFFGLATLGEPRSNPRGDWSHPNAPLDELATLHALDCGRLLLRGAVARVHRGGSGESLGDHWLEHLLHLARSRPAPPCIDDCPRDN